MGGGGGVHCFQGLFVLAFDIYVDSFPNRQALIRTIYLVSVVCNLTMAPFSVGGCGVVPSRTKGLTIPLPF